MTKNTEQVPRFAVCIDNTGYATSLEVGKLYQAIPDGTAATHGYIRVVDESGEDYGYAATRFFPSKFLRLWQMLHTREARAFHVRL